MRMIALGQAWQDRGGSVTLAACQCPTALIDQLQDEHIDFTPLGNLPLGGIAELKETIQMGKSLNAPWIVIDGYHFAENYQKSLKEYGFKVLAVDDYGHCKDWHTDLFLNQNIQESGCPETSDLSANGKGLVGTLYALLRREFRDGTKRVARKNPHPLRILVTFGGVDPTGATLEIMRSLNLIHSPQMELKVLAGPANPRLAELRSEGEKSRHPIEIIPSTRDMPSLYQWADRVISAGGSSCYEWMFFGIPGWITSIAGNQDQIVRAMLDQNQAAGLAEFPVAESEKLTESLDAWLNHPDPPCSSMVDGYGAQRVAAAISDTKCWVRPVREHEDARFLYDLANHESVRSAGRHTSLIPWEDHVAWLKRHCNTAHSRLMIIEALESGPVGQIRFHEVEPTAWEIGISIHPDFRKSRVALSSLTTAMIELSSKRNVTEWIAEIRNENHASQALFSKLGFRKIETHGDMQKWILPHPNSNNT